VVFGIKAAIFPLFNWLPDAYPTAAAPVTAIFAGLLTKIGVYAIIRTQTLVFAPEGTRSPDGHLLPFKKGAFVTAIETGLPILPVTVSAAPARRIGTWDRTLIPRPFSKGLYICAEPIVVERHAGRDEQEALRARLEETLDRITDEADRRTGLGPEEPRPPVSAS